MSKEQIKRNILGDSDKTIQEYHDSTVKACGKDRRKQAKAIFDSLTLDYGFEEAIKTGVYAPFPGEIKDMATCQPYAVLMYFLTDSLGLNPRFFNAYNLEVAEGDKTGDRNKADHSFIDVDTGGKKRILMDPKYKTFGSVTHNPSRRRIQIKDNPLTDHTKLQYLHMEEVSKEQLIEQMMFFRTPEGSVKCLEGGQRTRKQFQINRRKKSLWFRYNKKADYLETLVNQKVPIVANTGVSQRFHFDETGRIASKTLHLFGYSESGWMQHTNKTNIAGFDMKELQPFYEVLDDLLSTKDTNHTRNRKQNTTTLIDYLKSVGVKDFSVDEDRLPAGVDKHKVTSVMNSMDSLLEDKLDEYNDKGNLERSLLVRELYEIARSQAVSDGEDNDGYVYSQEIRDETLVSDVDDICSRIHDFADHVKKNRLREARIEDNKYGEVFMQRVNSDIDEKSLDVNQLIFQRRDDKRNYDDITDYFTYHKRNLKEKSIEEMREMVSQKKGSISHAYKQKLYHCLIYAYQARHVLEHREYLPKLASKIEDYKLYLSAIDKVSRHYSLAPEDGQELLEDIEDRKYAQNVKSYLKEINETLDRVPLHLSMEKVAT